MRDGARRPAFGSTLSVIATAAVMTACASSGSQPGTQAAPTHPAASEASTMTASSPHEFVSTRYGFAVTLPQDWSETDADFAWDGKGLQSPGSPFFANFIAPTSTRTLMAASVAVPDRTQLAAWQEAMVRGHLSSCSAPLYAPVKTTLGGEPALRWAETCDSGRVNSTKVAALHGGRGYMIYMPSEAGDNAEDLRIFEAMRQSFRFSR